MSGKIIFTTGSFSGNIGTDADGNINIETHNNAKKITFEGVKGFSGSAELDIDKDTGKIIRTTVNDVTTGTTFIRSGSTGGSPTGIGGTGTANQIQLQQTTEGALISCSGSANTTGFNLVEKDKVKLVPNLFGSSFKMA